MAHDRKLVISGISLTKARIPPRQAASALNRVRDEVEREMRESGYLDGAPFRWVGLSIREGLVDETRPHFAKIDPVDGELPLGLEIDANRLLGVAEQEMVAVYRRATLMALVHAGEKYRLKVDHLRQLLG